MIRKFLHVAVAALFLLSFVSCNGKGSSDNSYVLSGDIIEIIPGNSEESERESVRWSDEEGVVFVIFGYGYNEDIFYEKAKSLLSQTYGLSENGGLVECVKFPDDLHNRISNFRSIADEKNIRGIVVLGAPEGCHYTFARIREDRDNRPFFNIFSFFPQDDILGQEGTCNFVLDHESSAFRLEEQNQVMDDGIFDILVTSVKYAAVLPAELPSDNELHSHVQAIVGQRKVHRYVDGETGIQSRNHFVIEAAEK